MGGTLPNTFISTRYIPHFRLDNERQYSKSKSLTRCSDVTPEQVQAVLRSPPRAPQTDILGSTLAKLIAYTDAMTLDVQVPDAVFADLKEIFEVQQIVEITATISAYNCVSRFLVALDVGERNAQTGPKEGAQV